MTTTAAGRAEFITAGGKKLGEMNLFTWPHQKNGELTLQSIQVALKRFHAQPRSTLAADMAASPEIDPRRTAQQLPPGCLVIKVYNRRLEYRPGGELRYTVPKDYIKEGIPGYAYSHQTGRLAEASHDFLWVTDAEWKALLPAAARVEEPVPVPRPLRQRIFRFHLVPSRGLGEGIGWPREAVKEGDLGLVVTAVSAGRVQMRLEGEVNLETTNRKGTLGYRPRLLGYLEYDPKTQACTRFDIVAFGDMQGSPNGENDMGMRDGSRPLGVAFELVRNPSPADYLHPHGARDERSEYLHAR